MKKPTTALLLMGCILALTSLMAQSTRSKVIAEFRGSSLRWIHAAEPEFQRRNLDLDKYIVSVAEGDDSVMITLSPPDVVEGARRSSGSYPTFVVEVSKKDLKVVRSNYVK
jgi:hypothetical protein